MFCACTAFSQVQYKILEGETKGVFRMDFTREPPLQGPADSVWANHVLLGNIDFQRRHFYDSTGNLLFSVNSYHIRNSHNDVIHDTTGKGALFRGIGWKDVYKNPWVENNYIILGDRQDMPDPPYHGDLRHIGYDPLENNGVGKVTKDTLLFQRAKQFNMAPFLLMPGKNKSLFLIYSVSAEFPDDAPDTFLVFKYARGEFVPTGHKVVIGNGISYLKASHSGNKIAATAKTGEIFLLDFNTETGEISLDRILDV